MFDYLIVGAGLFGSVFAYEAKQRGKKCLVIDKRAHIGGNCFTQKVFADSEKNKNDFINIHLYGAHIFHTSNVKIWEYIKRFADFNHFINSPLANYKGEIYNLPFNMNTFTRLFGGGGGYTSLHRNKPKILLKRKKTPFNIIHAI